MYRVPLTLREGTRPLTICARSLPDTSLPTNCDMLIGLPAQEELELELKIKQNTAEIKLYDQHTGVERKMCF